MCGARKLSVCRKKIFYRHVRFRQHDKSCLQTERFSAVSILLTDFLSVYFDANLRFRFVRDAIIVKASYNIPKGGELVFNYQPNSKKPSSFLMLSNYGFVCTCDSCKDESDFVIIVLIIISHYIVARFTMRCVFRKSIHLYVLCAKMLC